MIAGMRWACLVLAATGCNPAFGLDRTKLVLDARPASCPPIGTAPRYTADFVQTIVADCHDYTPIVPAGLAVAGCAGATAPVNEAGPIDGPLAPIAVAPINTCVNLAYARLVPEGDRLYVDENNYDCDNNDIIGEYVPVDATTWQYVGDLGIPPSVGTDGEGFGSVTVAPNRHAMVTAYNDGSLHEWVQQGDNTWREVLPAYTSAELGIGQYGVYTAVNLTSDGLRGVFEAGVADGPGRSIYYIDRPTIADRFGPATPIVGVPDVVTDAFVTDDCTRIYFSGLGRIFFVEEE